MESWLGNKTLATYNLPSHRHGITTNRNYANQTPPLNVSGGGVNNQGAGYTKYEGGGSSHNHSSSFSGTSHNHSFSSTAINMAVKYINAIICRKDAA